MSDLDARVAALMEWVREYRFAGRSELSVVGGQVENAIRAELQKPALHEPVTDAEIDAALREYRNSCVVPGIGMRAQFGQVLESFLQGRAKPERSCTCHPDDRPEQCRKKYATSECQAAVKPAQEEITDCQIEAAAKRLAACMDYPWEHMPPEGRNGMRINAQAIIRASKGEKT